ncbi:MAG: sigma-54 dependent transcriptional regulator [Myxococcota bacterium]|nr:sigma-54 dependent transcriptional regulator [Myxococcota bacterium]
MTKKVLIVDDDKELCELTGTQLEKRRFQVCLRYDAAAALEAVSNEEFDAVVTDLNMPEMNGIELTEMIHQNRPDTPVIVITSYGSLETAIAAMRAGAYDFITKPIDIELLHITLNRAIHHRHLHKEVTLLRRTVEASQGFEEFQGESAPMNKVFSLVSKAAETEVTVLITGESGTGKELVARALHKRSKRQGGPFVAVNCSALPENLLESELFGHVKGAFTDAKSTRIGLFGKANKGTLFLDEIGDMPLGLQAKILRTLEERTVRPVGGNTETPFDVRVISATNRDLAQVVEDKGFREDLFYRLNVVHIDMPPLRQRGRDILLLADHFIDQFASQMQRDVSGLSTTAAEKLLGYSWPGNVRELKNSIERAMALTGTDKLTVDDLPERIRDYKAAHAIVSDDNPNELVTLTELERRYIQQVLGLVGGNKAQAARILGVDRKSLYRKLARLEGRKSE